MIYEDFIPYIYPENNQAYFHCSIVLEWFRTVKTVKTILTSPGKYSFI